MSKKYNFLYSSKYNKIINSSEGDNEVKFDDYYCGSEFKINVSCDGNQESVTRVFVNVYHTLTALNNIYRFYSKTAMSGVFWCNLKRSLLGKCPDAKNDFKSEETYKDCFRLLKKYYTVEEWIVEDMPVRDYVDCAKYVVCKMADRCVNEYPELRRVIEEAKNVVADECTRDKERWGNRYTESK